MQLSSARQPQEWRRATAGRGCVLPGVREPVGARELEDSHRRFRIVRTDDLQADPLHALQRLAAGDERGEQEVAERTVLVQERAQRAAGYGDVAQGLGHERAYEDRLPREQVQLAEEARGAVPDEFVPGRVDNRDLSFEDCDERVGAIADPVEQLTDGRRALLADRGESR